MIRSMVPAAAIVGATGMLASNDQKVVMPSVVASARPAAAPVAFAGGDVHDMTYYAKCMMGGVLSCGITHTAVVPLDIVKCRMQTNPEVYTGLISGLSKLSSAGASNLTIGWLPTLIGYSAQGLCKFGFYEVFKDLYAGLVGEENAANFRSLLYAAASASAEFIADVALCPMEAIKVRMQTSPPEAKFPTQLSAAMNRVTAEEGTAGFYKGLAPLWGRQVPYTIVKFVAFERVVEWFYTNMFTAPKESYSKSTQLGITFLSGYIAGVFCAVISHPADTIVSKLNQSDSATIGGIVNEMGVYNLATKGLGVRILMIGTLTGLQWWIYDSFKTAVGLQTTGGKAAPAPAKN
jgi:solute carrier family 25 phosphate transporter 3